MSSFRFVIAGFGGQGVLFLGKVIANAGMLDDKYVSWLPSYGPEMRGGTANCSVCVSDEQIYSPLVPFPDVLIAMNNPSLEKFCPSVRKNGLIVSDSTIVTIRSGRDDVEEICSDASRIAEENGVKGLSNMLILGLIYVKTGFCSEKALFDAVKQCTPKRKAEFLDLNIKAIRLGMEA